MTKLINCDECKKEFPLNVKTLEHPANKLKGYVIESYFRCPHCNTKYIAVVTDKQARKMQKEIRKFQQQIYKHNYSNLTEEEYKAKIDEQYEVHDAMKQKLRSRMDELKTQVLEMCNDSLSTHIEGSE